MKVAVRSFVSGESLSQKDLLTYLSQVVLSKTDEEIELASREAKLAKDQLDEAKTKLKTVKDNMNKLLIEHQKYKIMLSVLSKIDTLKREGVLVGENKNQIRKILGNIETKTIRQLKWLEDRLVTYVPDSPPKISFN
jgi:hypothetical protein